MPTLVILEVLLFFAVLQGYLSTRGMDATRFELNARQSTLAFGDNSGYLLLLSLCLFRFVRNTSNKAIKLIFQLLLIIAMIVSVFGIARAGSRGPFLAAIMGALFIFFAPILADQNHRPGGKAREPGGNEGGEESSGEEEEAPADETKSEAFNKFSKKGQYLSEKSDYIIGKLWNSRYDLLEEGIMTAVRAKIRQKIEAAKKQIKLEAAKR